MSVWDKIPEEDLQVVLAAIAEEKRRKEAGEPSSLRPLSEFTDKVRAALAAGTRKSRDAEQARAEACQSGPKGNAQTLSEGLSNNGK